MLRRQTGHSQGSLVGLRVLKGGFGRGGSGFRDNQAQTGHSQGSLVGLRVLKGGFGRGGSGFRDNQAPTGHSQGSLVKGGVSGARVRDLGTTAKADRALTGQPSRA